MLQRRCGKAAVQYGAEKMKATTWGQQHAQLVLCAPGQNWGRSGRM